MAEVPDGGPGTGVGFGATARPRSGVRRGAAVVSSEMTGRGEGGRDRPHTRPRRDFPFVATGCWIARLPTEGGEVAKPGSTGESVPDAGGPGFDLRKLNLGFRSFGGFSMLVFLAGGYGLLVMGMLVRAVGWAGMCCVRGRAVVRFLIPALNGCGSLALPGRIEKCTESPRNRSRISRCRAG